MPTHSPRHRALLASAICAAWAVTTAAPSAASSPALASAASAAASTRLFPDSRMIMRDRISVEVVGRGPDLVFVPGLASARATWRATAERLRGRYRLHFVQVAGFAGEPARANASGPVVAPTAEAIDAYIVEQKLSPAVLIGHSLGGTMALYLAERHPEHLRKVLIVDALPWFGALMGGPGATPESVKAMVDKMNAQAASKADPAASARFQAAMMAAMVKAPADRARITGWSQASDHAVVGRAMGEDMMLDLRPGLPAVRTPVTLLYPDDVPVGAPAGMMDRVYGAAYATLPGIRETRVDDSLHFIMFDQPQAFAAALDTFLAR